MSRRRDVPVQLGAFTAGGAALTGAAGGPALAGSTARVGGPARSGHRALVIGHRGASGYRPEHTLAAYELAARMGADYLEPDLVITRDRVLVARHEPEISATTDVATRPEFAHLHRTKFVDGAPVTGWFADDFTLAELKSLRAIERVPDVRQENTVYNGLFQVPTLTEILDLRARLSRELRREIGVYPETKHPTYFEALGLPLEPVLVRVLRRAGLDRRDAPVFVQSFEAASLRRLRQRYGLRARTVFLTSGTGTPFNDPRPYAEYLDPAGLRDVRRFADGIGPEKSQVIPRAADGRLGTPSDLVADAHAAGLLVHPYTFRAENQFLPTDLRIGADPAAYGRAIDEQVAFLRVGADGLFTDNPDIGVLAREMAAAERSAARAGRKAQAVPLSVAGASAARR